MNENKTYKLIKKLKSLPKDWEIGMILGTGGRNDDTYSPCSAKYTDIKLPISYIVEHPKIFKELSFIEEMQNTINSKHRIAGYTDDGKQLISKVDKFLEVHPLNTEFYILKKKLRNHPKNWEIGMMIGRNREVIEVFSPVDTKYENDMVCTEEIRTHPEAWERVERIFNECSKKMPEKIRQVDLGTRDNKDKPQWSLIDFLSLEPMVKVMAFGAEKYGKYNWMQGLKTTEICDSMLRHIFAYLNGEDTDKESGLPIEGHILCNAMFLSYMIKNRKDLDTRNK